MRHPISALALALAAFAGTAASATNFTTYNFSETVNGYSVTGSFDGTLSGNVISNLQNISVFVNGVAFLNNGSLYAVGYDNASGNLTSNAWASLDGTNNNFGFFNYNGNEINDAFYSINGSGNSSPDTIYMKTANIYTSNSTASDNFRAQAASASAVPEPSTWAMMLIGFGAVGFAMRRKTKVAVRFG